MYILSFYLVCILQLLSYALHRNSVIHNGIDSSIESGYSVYVFNTTRNHGDYCIFDEYQNFGLLRTLLFIAFGLLELTSVFSIPLLLASIYDEFKRKMSNENNHRYFVWATLILIVPIILLLFCCNTLAIINGLSSPRTKYNDIFAGFIVMAVLMVVLPVVDLLAAIVVVGFYFIAQLKDEMNCFGYPYRVNTTRKCSCLKNFVHIGVIVVVTWFTQLALFNSIYVFIGAIAAPVETGSLLLLYITSLFALISFFAVILKVFRKTLPTAVAKLIARRADEQPVENAPPAPDAPPVVEQQSEPSEITITCCQGCSCFTCFVPFLLLVIVLAAGIGVFVSFIYLYVTLNQEYRNNRGILTFLGALLPSLLASTSGFFWTQIIPCIGKRKEPGGNEADYLKKIAESLDQIKEKIGQDANDGANGRDV